MNRVANRLGSLAALVGIGWSAMSDRAGGAEEVGAKLVVRGQISTTDGRPLPKDVVLRRRVSGSGFVEGPKNVKFAADGSFAIELPYNKARIALYATSSEYAPAAVTGFEVENDKDIPRVEVRFDLGFAARIRLRAKDGSHPTSGTAAVAVRNSFDPELGVYPISETGEVTIPHCPEGRVQVDLLGAGFEEQRLFRSFSPTEVADVLVRPTRAAKFRLVSAVDGLPIANAKVRLFTRNRAGGMQTPLYFGTWGRVWATSDGDGNVELTLLRVFDPLPTNAPDMAVYSFYVQSQNHAPHFVGNVKAGDNLGEIRIGAPLEIRGEVVFDAKEPEVVSIQWQQATTEKDGARNSGSWKYPKVEPQNGLAALHLKNLRPGPIELYVTYTDRKTVNERFPRTFSQKRFEGILSGSADNLKITRDGITTNGENLKLVSDALFSADDRGNMPQEVIDDLAKRALVFLKDVGDGHRTGGYQGVRLVIFDDGLVFVPGGIGNNAGAHYRLSPQELLDLIAFIGTEQEFFEIPSDSPDNWDISSTELTFNHAGRSATVVRPHNRESEARLAKITDRLEEISTQTSAGGKRAIEIYRNVGNRTLRATLPEIEPLDGKARLWAQINPDGTRELYFHRTENRVTVRLEHPLGGEPYVQSIEKGGERIPVKEPPAE